LSLSAYFDVLPEPALILECSRETISDVESFKVCYVNRAFNDPVGVRSSAHKRSSLGAVGQEKVVIGTIFNESVFQETCITPSPALFMDWVKGIIQAPNDLHFLQSRFKVRGYTQTNNALDGPPPFLDIDWNGLVIKGRFVVLTGRTNTTVMSRTGTVSPESLPQRDTANPVPVDVVGAIVSPISPDTDTPKRKSPSSPPRRVSRTSSKDIKTPSPRTTSSSPSSDRPHLQMRNSFTLDESPSLSTWRNNEKVIPNRTPLTCSSSRL
jgi:hypothetical protein